MHHYIYQIVPGKLPIPLLPYDRDRRARVEDGETIFGLDAAVRQSGMRASDLMALWEGTWGEYYTPDESPIAPSPTPATGGASEPLIAGRANASQPDPMARVIDSARTAGLRNRYGDWADEHFDEFIEKCKLRDLNPHANQVYGVLQFDRHRDKQVVQLLIGIEGMRLIAHRTGLYAGCDKAIFEPDADGNPDATVTVYRLTDGLRHPYTAQTHWREYAPPASANDEVWPTKGHTCISKCAEAAALRKAFPQELGGLYAPEEWAQARAINKQKPTPHPKAYSQLADYLEDDAQVSRMDKGIVSLVGPTGTGAPKTWPAFTAEMEALGLGELDRIGSLVANFRTRWAGIADRNPPEFWRRILEEVRKDPERWGAMQSA